MAEIRSLAAADRFRLLQEGLRARDQQRDDNLRARRNSFDDNLRQRALIEGDVRLGERRVQDRRDIIEGERALSDQLRDQRRTLDTLRADDAFVARQDNIQEELNASRDGRDLNESLLLRDIAGDRNEANELRTLEQRQEDLRLQLNEREARIVERRLQERADAIQEEIDLRRSLERIRNSGNNSQSGAERGRGDLLDVSG